MLAALLLCNDTFVLCEGERGAVGVIQGHSPGFGFAKLSQ